MFALVCCSGLFAQDAEPLQSIVAAMERVQAAQASQLQSYVVTRRYVLDNSRFDRHATMVVEITQDAERGKTFQVLSTEGSEDVHRKVFQKLLDGEMEASRSGNLSTVSSQNYTFDFQGRELMAGRDCYVLGTTPKFKNKFLLKGRVWVDVAEHAVVRFEGKPAANVSFWVGKPWMVQEFSKVGAFWLAQTNRSRSTSRLLGATNLTITSTSYEIGPRLTARTEPAKVGKPPIPRSGL